MTKVTLNVTIEYAAKFKFSEILEGVVATTRLGKL